MAGVGAANLVGHGATPISVCMAVGCDRSNGGNLTTSSGATAISISNICATTRAGPTLSPDFRRATEKPRSPKHTHGRATTCSGCARRCPFTSISHFRWPSRTKPLAVSAFSVCGRLGHTNCANPSCTRRTDISRGGGLSRKGY